MGVKELFCIFIMIILIIAISTFSIINKKHSEKEYTFGEITNSKSSPKDRIDENNIKIFKNRVTIELKDAILAKFTDTKSMEPTIDKFSNAIEIKPKNLEDINIGDIISYHSELIDADIIHRVINKSYDKDGIYFRTKGDNLENIDPEKIRPKQVRRIVVGIIY